jgi:hypothetical protein
MPPSTSISSRTEDTEIEKQWESPTPPNDEEAAFSEKEKREEEQKDPNIVDWDGPDDQENPRNWSTLYKSWLTFQLSMLALAASMGSSINSPADDTIGRYVGVSSEVAVLGISLYV